MKLCIRAWTNHYEIPLALNSIEFKFKGDRKVILDRARTDYTIDAVLSFEDSSTESFLDIVWEDVYLYEGTQTSRLLNEENDLDFLLLNLFNLAGEVIANTDEDSDLPEDYKIEIKKVESEDGVLKWEGFEIGCGHCSSSGDLKNGIRDCEDAYSKVACKCNNYNHHCRSYPTVSLNEPKKSFPPEYALEVYTNDGKFDYQVDVFQSEEEAIEAAKNGEKLEESLHYVIQKIFYDSDGDEDSTVIVREIWGDDEESEDIPLEDVVSILNGLQGHCMAMAKKEPEWDIDGHALAVTIDLLHESSTVSISKEGVEKVISRLEGLKEHCEDFADPEDEGSLFSDDCKALEYAIKFLKNR